MSDWLPQLRAIVGDCNVLLGADMAAFESGARYGRGRALCVVRPANAEEVAAVVRLCVEQRIPLVAQGANTGLVGASTPDASGRQLVLSLSRMRTISIDVGNRSATVDAGVRLHQLNAQLEPLGYWFPVDLGADPSIGGMIAANTGGTRLIRYGDVRHNLLALEAVLLHPAGNQIRFGRALRKDNTGFDLKQLFVGTSGVGGVTTRATLAIHPRPRQAATALVVPASDAAVIELLTALETQLGDFLSAFEGMSASAMRAAIDHLPNLRDPFAPEPIPDFAILIELESSASPSRSGLDLQSLLNDFLQDHFDTLLSAAMVGNGPELWRLRHGISEGARHLGRIIAFDVSVPRSAIMAFRRAARALVATSFPQLRAVDFGHIADGGVHFNLIWPHEAEEGDHASCVQRLRDALYALAVERFDGSFSAEHGVGPHNLAYYQRYTCEAAKEVAGGIKRLLDPLALCGSVDFGPSG